LFIDEIKRRRGRKNRIERRMGNEEEKGGRQREAEASGWKMWRANERESCTEREKSRGREKRMQRGRTIKWKRGAKKRCWKPQRNIQNEGEEEKKEFNRRRNK
jgi:hypothetical protein